MGRVAPRAWAAWAARLAGQLGIGYGKYFLPHSVQAFDRFPAQGVPDRKEGSCGPAGGSDPTARSPSALDGIREGGGVRQAHIRPTAYPAGPCQVSVTTHGWLARTGPDVRPSSGRCACGPYDLADPAQQLSRSRLTCLRFSRELSPGRLVDQGGGAARQRRRPGGASARLRQIRISFIRLDAAGIRDGMAGPPKSDMGETAFFLRLYNDGAGLGAPPKISSRACAMERNPFLRPRRKYDSRGPRGIVRLPTRIQGIITGDQPADRLIGDHPAVPASAISSASALSL